MIFNEFAEFRDFSGIPMTVGTLTIDVCTSQCINLERAKASTASVVYACDHASACISPP